MKVLHAVILHHGRGVHVMTNYAVSLARRRGIAAAVAAVNYFHVQTGL